MPALRVLCLSEDGSDHAHEVVVALSKAMLKIVDPSTQTQRERLQFDEERGDARRAMRANLWRSAREDDEPFIRALMRAIVRHLLIVDDEGRRAGFVFFHYDGDTRHEDRDNSDARRHFADFRLKIEQQVRAAAGDDAAADAMRGLIAVEPFYCIEAWTYQHTDVARQICARMCGKHGPLFSAWEQKRGDLDEIRKPWDRAELDCCLGKHHNVELTARGYPAEAVWSAGKSFYGTVDRMGDCPALVLALARTYTETYRRAEP